MKYGCFDVVTIRVLDKDLNEITILDTLKNSRIVLDTEPSYINVTDSLFDYELLKAFNKHNDLMLEVYLNFRGNEDGLDHIFIMQVPSCQVTPKFDISNGFFPASTAVFKWKFTIDGSYGVYLSKKGEETRMQTKKEMKERVDQLFHKLKQDNISV